MRSLVFTLLLVVTVQAQSTPTQSTPTQSTPTLTEVQRLQLQTIAQRIEIAQLKAQAAQREFDVARGDLTRLMDALKVAGYTLDLGTMNYQKEKEKK